MKTLFPYGLDAPPVVRNLLIAAGACLALVVVGKIDLFGVQINGFQWPALGFAIGAASMAWSSAVGKLQRRDRLVDKLTWVGSEQVLDLGCGRGLMAIGVAKRLTTGHVTGIDLWQAEDLSGNEGAAVLVNAVREGVSGRVSVHAADMRELPFEANSIDVVVSATAIHNIYEVAGRDKAIDEIARVLKPGGRVLIYDIRHTAQYAKRLADHGFAVEQAGPGLSGWFWRIVAFGTLNPGTLLARTS
jgi:arsenite methyltransferase